MTQYTQHVRLLARKVTAPIDNAKITLWFAQYSKNGKNWQTYNNGQTLDKNSAFAIILAHSAKTDKAWNICNVEHEDFSHIK